MWGPAAFVGGWALLGTRVEGYSPVDDPISRLAAVGASTRVGMTVALVVFALGMALYGSAMRGVTGRPFAVAAGVNAAATLGVAATPLDSWVGGAPHGLSALVGYVSLAALPVLAAPHYRRSGRPFAAATSVVVGVLVAAALAASLVVDGSDGLWQRVGLTLGDLWVAASVVALWRGARARKPGTATTV